MKRCPECGREYEARPAISRKDNVTPICPDCGIRQALEGIGVAPEEREKILALIHEYASGFEKEKSDV